MNVYELIPMYMNLYECICMCIKFKNDFSYPCIWMYMIVYKNMRIFEFISIYIYIYMNVFGYIYMYKCIWMDMHAYECMRMYMNM